MESGFIYAAKVEVSLVFCKSILKWEDHLLLESVYENRKVIESAPYPENYIEQKERNV